MAKTEESFVIVRTARGAMKAQTIAEQKYGHLNNFAIVSVSPHAPREYKVCYQYDK